MDYDFTGWATRANLKCSDGKTIMRDAFKHQDHTQVPLVWGHQHDDPNRVLGHALLENRDEGVYVYGTFNDTENAQTAKLLVQHGDVNALSIYANQLKQNLGNVIHGNIREVSLVLAGANPGAYIDSVIAHGEESDEEAYIYTDETLCLRHEDGGEDNSDNDTEDTEEEDDMAEKKTVGDIINSMTKEQKELVYALAGEVLEDAGDEYDDEYDDEEDEEDMKHNLFDADKEQGNFLSHADEESIIALAKSTNVGSLQAAMDTYAEENALQHDAFENMGALFPDYELIDPKKPDILYDDDSWVAGVINGVHKSPIARVRTRRADARKSELEKELKAKGYKKGEEKKIMDKIKLVGRTHDPQTVYIKDALNRDDILDITDFDVVDYEWGIMRHTLNQTIAEAILIGDGRDDIDPDKIKEEHIRPIWKDKELYCIHQDVDIAKAKQELQGTDTGANFGENYIYAEAIITAALYAREKYKGSGNLTFYCTPHLLNVMLLARDLNGRRIYSSKNDLVAALNVSKIETIEQFEGLTRDTEDNKKKQLLGLFVNLKDYQVGCVKGGEITKFDQFDIDFNLQKMLLETRISGALTEWYSAIALELDVTNTASNG